MCKRVWFTVAATVIAYAAAWGAPAAAHDGGDNGHADWLAPGVFQADGDGIAAADGTLNLQLCAEDGLLLASRDAEVPADTYDETAEWVGLQVYFGFHGCVEFEGHSAAGLASGHGLTLRAEGVGAAFLEGDGEWASNGGDTQPWPADGATFHIGSRWLDPTPEPEPTDGPEAAPTS